MVAILSLKYSLPQLLSAAAVTWTLQIFLRKWVTAKRVAWSLTSFLPGGAVILFHPFRTLSLVMGPFHPFKGQMGWMWARFSCRCLAAVVWMILIVIVYKKFGNTFLSSATFWDAVPIYWIADADAAKAICSDRFTFTKDVEAYETLNIYGPSIVGLEDSAWKRHRAIAKTAFNEANNAFVWRESLRIVNEWFTEIDRASTLTDSKALTTDVALLRDLTRVTLLIIASAGFGRRSPWLEEISSLPPPGHRLHLGPAITSAIGKLFIHILTPKPIWHAVTERGLHIPVLSPMLLKARDAFFDLRKHMEELVSQARNQFGVKREAEDDGAALLKNLVEANMTFDKSDETAYRGLTDGEVFSDMFVFFLAGHETSAHTLCFAFVYLALHPNFQQRVFEESLKIYPQGIPTIASSSAYKDNMPQLEFTSAVFHETLRLRPPVPRLAKLAQKDTVLKSRRFTTSPEGRISVTQEVGIPIQKGGMCVLDIPGIHMNPIHWGDDAEVFNPVRFIDTDVYKWPRHAFYAFSGGPRSCIGQRFAITESVCVIASIVRRYEILPPTDVLGLSVERQVEMLAQWSPGVTVIPTNARVRFRRRAV